MEHTKTALTLAIAVLVGCSSAIAPGEPSGGGSSSSASELMDATSSDGIAPTTGVDASSSEAGGPVDATSSDRSTPIPAAGGLWDGRVPQNHVASRPACPQQRGPGLVGCNPDAGVASPTALACLHDSDCSAGENGRCAILAVSSLPPDAGSSVVVLCGSSCSYDACFSDAECPAHVPCECRTSATDTAANVCLTGSGCSVDADCGPGGFCSATSWTQTGGQVQYYCHTANDSCLDDSDCPTGKYCQFDTVSARWMCVAAPHIIR